MTLLKKGQVLQQLLVEAVRKDNVLPLTGLCNLSCIFCSHRNNPPGTQAFSFAPLREETWADLAQYLDPERKIIIGESATRLREGEPFTHPQLQQVLQKLRLTYPETPIQLTTNGSLFQKDTAAFLASVKPLKLVISLNSASAKWRRIIMNDSNPEKALAVPEMLMKHNIPFHGSLVALPHLTGFNDLDATVTELDRCGAQTIRMLLPGYTAQSDPSIISPPGTIKELYAYAAGAGTRFKSVVLVEPPLIEDLQPLLEGVIGESPACRAGLQSGDRIDSVDGVTPLTRVEAFNLIDSKAEAQLVISRANINVETVIKDYSSQASGLVMNYDLDPNQVLRVKSRLSDQVKTLMLLSEPALLRWQIAAVKFGLENITFKTVRSCFFGGSINCAGLLTVSDYQVALHETDSIRQYGQVLIPSVAFDHSGRDMSGIHYHNLQTDRSRLSLIC
jgi:NifB/MoaA-like Fe-S oxidoreductase